MSKHRQTQFSDDEVYPVSASALPSNAHHIHACRIIGQSQPYAACLKRIADFEAGEIQEAYTECRRAIGGPACDAWKMRAEEAKAGHALYYLNRSKLRDFYTSLIATDGPSDPVSAHQSVESVKPTSTPAPDPFATQGGSYAEAINATIKTLSSPTEKPLTDSQPATNPGETPLEYIRRIKAEALQG